MTIDDVDTHLAPLDVAVVDRDRLWRVEVMNALRPLYAEIYEDAGEVAPRVHPGDATVVVVGSGRGAATMGDLAALRDRCPRVGIVVVAAADHQPSTAPTAVDELVDRWLPAGLSEEQVVVEVRRFLQEREVVAEVAEPLLVGDQGAALVVVTSAKGGVGRSTVALNLAVAWATEHGAKVAVVETDPYFGDLTAVAGVRPPPSWQELRGLAPTELALAERCRFTLDPSGVTLLVPPLPVDVWTSLGADDAARAVASVVGDHDAVVVDVAPRLLGSGVLVDAADLVYVVAPTEQTGLRHGYLVAVSLHRRFGGTTPVELVFMDRDGHGEMASSTSSPAGIAVAASVPHDRRVPAASAKRRPVVESHPRTGAGRALRALAAHTAAAVDRHE